MLDISFNTNQKLWTGSKWLSLFSTILFLVIGCQFVFAAQEIDQSKLSASNLLKGKSGELYSRSYFDSRMFLKKFIDINPNANDRTDVCNIGFIEINNGINAIKKISDEQRMCLHDWAQWRDAELPWDIQGVNFSTSIQDLLHSGKYNCSFTQRTPMKRVDGASSAGVDVYEIPMYCVFSSWDYATVFFRVLPDQNTLYINQILFKACLSLPYLAPDSDTYKMIEKKYKNISKDYRVVSRKSGNPIFEDFSGLVPIGGITGVTVRFKSDDELFIKVNSGDRECGGKSSLSALFMNQSREFYIKDKFKESKREFHEKFQPVIKF